MKLKKLIGIVSTVSVMALSMSAVCVYAEGEPALEDWTLTPVYKETFDGLSGNEQVLYTAIQKRNANWVYSRDDGNALSSRSGEDAAVSFNWARSLAYNSTASEGAYYYNYTIQAGHENSSIRLGGLEEGEIMNGSGVVEEKQEFTTVVDPVNKAAYTYDSTGKLLGTVSIPDNGVINGIVFEQIENNRDYSFWIYDFNYGTASLGTEESETKTATFEFDESIEDINNKETIEVTITPDGEEAQKKTGDLQSLMDTHLSGEGNVKFAVVLTNIPESATVNSVTIY